MFPASYFGGNYFPPRFFAEEGDSPGAELLDIQVSYMRLLIGDNSRTAPTYNDSELRENITLGPDRPPFPIALRLAGVKAAVQYPSDKSGGPFTGPF